MLKFPNNILSIIEELKKNGHKAYIVGGSVRDILLGISVYDFDIATDAHPEIVTKYFKKVIPTGIDFGTVRIIDGSDGVEVTTFRKDGRYIDGRRPERISFSSNIDEDLSRRDFTINAIAYDPIEDILVDPFDGRKDLEKKIIRAVGDPIQRFSEDGLRSLRACRFAAKLVFSIEESTLSAIGETISVFNKVSAERVHDEIVKMLAGDRPSIGFEYMRRTGLLKEVIPELFSCIGISQPEQFHQHDVYYHSIYSCDNASKDNIRVRLAALLHDIAKPLCKIDDTFYNHDITGSEISERIMKRLKFSNEDIGIVANLVKNHMFNYTASWSDSAVRRFIRRVGRENLEDLFQLRIADMKAMEKGLEYSYIMELRGRIEDIISKDDALAVKDLRVDGNDIMAIPGVKKGPGVGKVLEHLLDIVVEDPSLNKKEILLAKAQEYFRQK